MPAGDSHFGTITLAPGFTPDPHIVPGISGGNVDASTLNPQCRGYVSSQPDHVFVSAGQFNLLRILVNGGSTDTTLVIRKPDGTYVCDDDSAGQGFNPAVQAMFSPGIHQIYVGSYAQGENYPYNLAVTESPTLTLAQVPLPASGGVQAAPAAGAMDSYFGTITLAPGFVPDPHVVEGLSGGDVSASSFSSQCRGYVSAQPDHIFVAMGQFNSLRVLVNAGSSDTTLVIRRPDGSYICDDDGGDSLNPLVQSVFAPGTYQIHVGSWQSGQNYPYNLAVTELSSITTAQVPLPSSAGAPAAAVPTGGVPTITTVAPGFIPDPQVLAGTAGGTMAANQMNSACRGYVTSTPNHIVNVTGNFSTLRLIGSAAGDTTLVVRTPTGAFLCDDDGGGNRNPLVQGAFPAGSYQVWVGTWSSGESVPYRVGISEMAHINATNF